MKSKQSAKKKQPKSAKERSKALAKKCAEKQGKEPGAMERWKAAADAKRNEIETKPRLTRFPLVNERKAGNRGLAEYRTFLRNTLLSEFDKARFFRLLDESFFGDDVAPRVLLDIAAAAVKALRSLAQSNPDSLRPLARKCFVWPDFIGDHKGATDWNHWLLETLDVGKESIERGQWNPNARATQQASAMLNWLLNNQSALGVPPLTAKTRKLWFSTGWKALLVETNGHPEHHPYMRKIGTHYGDHSKNTGAQAKVTNATREANIRGGIRKQLWQSFKSVTKNIPPE